MIARLRQNQLETLLAVIAIALVLMAGREFFEARSSSEAAQEAEAQAIELLDEAAQYDINALLDVRDNLATGGSASALPTRSDAEFKISQVAGLISVSGLELGPIFQNELSAVVANDDVGIAGEVPPPRTYSAIELTLEINGDVSELLDLADGLLNEIEGATIADLLMEQDAVARMASLAVRILFFHRDG